MTICALRRIVSIGSGSHDLFSADFISFFASISDKNWNLVKVVGGVDL